MTAQYLMPDWFQLHMTWGVCKNRISGIFLNVIAREDTIGANGCLPNWYDWISLGLLMEVTKFRDLSNILKTT